MRRAAKRDENHKSVGDYLRAQGWSVLDLADHGDGVPDYAVSKPGFACLVEVKNPEATPVKRELTPAEQGVRNRWQGPYIVAFSGEQAHVELMLQMHDRLALMWLRSDSTTGEEGNERRVEG